jgi:hypothetical protein
MFLREAPTDTLATVRQTLEAQPGTSVLAEGPNVSVKLTDPDKQTLRVNDIEVPFYLGALDAFSGWLDAPKAFLRRCDPQLQEVILNHLLHRKTDEAVYRVSEEHGLLEIRRPGARVLNPDAMIDVMQKILGEDAPVVAYEVTPDLFRLDTVVPDEAHHGIGGDKPKGRQVGDLTKGGVRIIQNRKMNHAPSLSEFYYRLVCTNGMEVDDEGYKIDARGQSVEEVLQEMELLAQRIMGRWEERIRHFYELREIVVQTPEQAVLRMADEQGISDRVATEIIRAIPTITGDDGSTTQFDLVNLVTNFANEPTIARREGSRLLLERAGGATVFEHAERCAHCQSRLN